MAKILVTPINPQFPIQTIEGKLESKYFPKDGLIYYIQGRSFPANIVTIIEED